MSQAKRIEELEHETLELQEKIKQMNIKLKSFQQYHEKISDDATARIKQLTKQNAQYSQQIMSSSKGRRSTSLLI